MGVVGMYHLGYQLGTKGMIVVCGRHPYAVVFLSLRRLMPSYGEGEREGRRNQAGCVRM